MNQENKSTLQTAKDNQITLAGIIGLIGCVTVVVTHFLTIILLDGYDPIHETISDLAAGRYGWIMDLGLVIYALSLIVCAWGLYVSALGGNKRRWRAGLIALGILGLDVFIIAVYNEYGDGDFGGPVIHIYLVYILGFSFAAAVWFVRLGLERIHGKLRPISSVLVIIWLVAAPPFLFLPTNWDGAYERLLAGIMITWTALISWYLFRLGRKKVSVQESKAA